MKRLMAMILVCCMLMLAIPGIATEADTTVPSADSILNEYYRETFAAKETRNGASSRSIGSNKSLEEETVDTLRDAGYDAYFITSENYDAVEVALNTDLAALGLDPNGAYIIAIGTTEACSNRNPNSRGGDQFDQEAGGNDGGVSTEFTHPVNGITYTMREITIATHPDVNLKPDVTMSLADLMGICSYSGNILSMLHTAVIASNHPITSATINRTFLSTWAANSYCSATFPGEWELKFNCSWTRKYIQVWNAEYVRWHTGQHSSMVQTNISAKGTVFNLKTKQSENINASIMETSHYSQYYQSFASRCANAVLGMQQDTTYADFTGDICFNFKNSAGTALVSGYLFLIEEPLGYMVPTYEYPY